MDAGRRPSMPRFRRAVRLAIDVACTVLTLITGLQENPILLALSGRYALVRARLAHGSINYHTARSDMVAISHLPRLDHVSATYRFITAPDRSPANLGEDRSTCLRVNSMRASTLAIQFDDVFGRGARREQVFLYSISAPNCQVLNLEPAWLAHTCIERMSDGNATRCYEYVFAHFDALRLDRRVQVSVEQDFGAPGRPVLKCSGRPSEPFEYATDLMVQQSYWAGGSFHIEFQSSKCRAVPVARDANWEYGLFVAEALDQSASVVCALPASSWLASVVAVLFGFVSLMMIVRGIYVALSPTHFVRYVPRAMRTRVLGLFRSPMVALDVCLCPPAKRTDVLLTHGERSFASDLWMNHWLYILLSILDAVVSIRTTYVVLEMGAWMLTKQQNFENFLFVCTAITRLTWLTCFVHTLLRYGIKALVKVLAATSTATRTTSRTVVWYVDASALFVSYKVYAVLLSSFLYVLLHLRGTTSFMTRQSPSTAPVAGGFANIAPFWRSEVVCDLGLTCAVALGAGHALATALLCTKYKRLTHNRLLHLLQDRYVFVGWDVFVTLEALEMDVDKDALVLDGVAMTNCSFGSLLQQLYASGPSGLVEFAGDAVFLAHNATHSKGALTALSLLRFTPHNAQHMGLYTPHESATLDLNDVYGHRMLPSLVLDERAATASFTLEVLPPARQDGNELSATYSATRMRRVVPQSVHTQPAAAFKSLSTSERGKDEAPRASKRFADRLLRIHSTWRFGMIVLVDFQDAPGRLVHTRNRAQMEFVVPDALSLLAPTDVSAFASRSRLKLRIS